MVSVDLHEIAAMGNRIDTLRVLRDVLAAAILDAKPGQLAPLAKQLRDTMAELAALSSGEEVSASDDLSARRVARRANPENLAPPAGHPVLGGP